MISNATRYALSTASVRMAIVLMATLLFAGCTPTVKVATDEPITINLNVNIKHEILVKVDKDLDDIFADDSDIF
jgi:hypothetical protein